MSDEPETSGSRLANLRAMFDKNPPKIKKVQQYQHGKGHALNNLASTDQEPINPLGKNVNPNSSASEIFHSTEYSPVKRASMPTKMSSPTKELKVWNPQARRGNNTDRPLFAHDQRPINPFGKNVNPNANATELLEERVKASQEYEAKMEQSDDKNETERVEAEDSDNKEKDASASEDD